MSRNARTVNPFFGVFDIALAALSARSIVISGMRAPWTCAGWAGTLGYCIASALEYGGAPLRGVWVVVSYACIGALTAAFIVAGVRDEPQAEPWWWPRALGRTRKERS